MRAPRGGRPWLKGVPIRDRSIIFSLALCFLKHSGFRFKTTGSSSEARPNLPKAEREPGAWSPRRRVPSATRVLPSGYAVGWICPHWRGSSRVSGACGWEFCVMTYQKRL